MSEKYDDPSPNKVSLIPGRRACNTKVFKLEDINLPLKYSGPNPLPEAKLKDLKDLVQFIVPAYKAEYYLNIIREHEGWLQHWNQMI